MIKKIAASVLLKKSMVKASSSTSSVSQKGYFQPKEPEAIAKLRNRNVSCNNGTAYTLRYTHCSW